MDLGSEPKFCPDYKGLMGSFVSGPQDKPFSLDRAYTLIDGILSKF